MADKEKIALADDLFGAMKLRVLARDMLNSTALIYFEAAA